VERVFALYVQTANVIVSTENSLIQSKGIIGSFVQGVDGAAEPAWQR
jgi:hypothetical protein